MNGEGQDKKNLTEVVSAVRQTLAERLPQMASTTAKGLVPLSLALGLAPVIQSPESVFMYLAGLAPNLISDMLLEMRLGERKLDVDALAEAIAERLDDPGLRRLADELQIITSTAQALQAHGKQLKELSQHLSQELEKSGWPVPSEAQVIIGDMVAQGEYIAQAKERGIAVVAGAGAIVNIPSARPEVPRRRFLRILIGSAQDLEEERLIVKDAIKSLHLEPEDPELKLVGSQSVSPLEAHQAIIQDCDIYVGLLGGRYGHPVVSGKSVTQFEVETARESQKPILLYRKELPEAEIDEPQKALIAQLGDYKYGYHIHTFNPLDGMAGPGKRSHNLGEDLSGIPSHINNRLRTTLLKCGPFRSDDELRAVFVDARINPWRNRLPETSNPASRVRAIINFLYDQASATKENALVLLLRVLRDEVDPRDICSQELEQLANELAGIRQVGPTSPQAQGMPALGIQVQKDIQALLSGQFSQMPQPKPRVKPTSGRRGLIASLGRSPGAVTGLYYALEQAGTPIDYVRTISTSEFEVKRAVRTVREELKEQGMLDHKDIPISAEEFAGENDVMEFKAAFSALLTEARINGDAVAIGISGGRTVMGALLTLVAQMEAPADSHFYQLSVPDAIEEDGRYPKFHNQPRERKAEILRPTEFFPEYCHLIEIPFSRFYTEAEAA